MLLPSRVSTADQVSSTCSVVCVLLRTADWKASAPLLYFQWLMLKLHEFLRIILKFWWDINRISTLLTSLIISLAFKSNGKKSKVFLNANYSYNHYKAVFFQCIHKPSFMSSFLPMAHPLQACLLPLHPKIFLSIFCVLTRLLFHSIYKLSLRSSFLPLP